MRYSRACDVSGDVGNESRPSWSLPQGPGSASSIPGPWILRLGSLDQGPGLEVSCGMSDQVRGVVLGRWWQVEERTVALELYSR